MAQRLPSLNALRAFEASARHLSLSRAAEELHVTPAAISHQVKALEADLGVRLLRRAGGGLRLTEAAQAGLPDLRAAFDRLAQAARKIRDQGSARLLTVSVTPSFAATWLVPRLDRFKALQPDIDLRLDASVMPADFARDQVDVAIRYGAGDYPGLHSIRVFGEEMFPVCSPKLLERGPPLRRLDDLRRHTLLHLDWTPEKGEWPDWRMWLLAAGIDDVDASRGPRFLQYGLVLQAAVQGHGVALGSTVLVADDLLAGRLVRPLDLSLPLSFAYYVVCPPETAAQPRIAAFRDWLLAEAGHPRQPQAGPGAAGR